MAEVLINSNGGGASGTVVRAGGTNILGEALSSGIGGVLTKVRFDLQKVLSPTGNCFAKVYAVGTGTLGTNARPSNGASPLATSDAIDSSTVSTTQGYVTFAFSGGNQITLSPNTNYCVVFTFNSGDATNFLRCYNFNTGGTHPGNRVASSDDGATYTTSADGDINFNLYATTPGGAGVMMTY